MSSVICSFGSCGNKTEINEARRCQACGRIRCSRCGRCWHELAPGATPGSSQFLPSQVVGRSTSVRTPSRVPLKGKGRSGHKGRRPEYRRTAASTPRRPSSEDLSQADADRLRELNHLHANPHVPPLAAQLLNARARADYAASDTRAHSERRLAAAQSEVDHQAMLAKLRSKSPRLPTSTYRAAARHVLSGRPRPIVDPYGAATGARCPHGMERMNCALCNRRRFPAPIKTRR